MTKQTVLAVVVVGGIAYYLWSSGTLSALGLPGGGPLPSSRVPGADQTALAAPSVDRTGQIVGLSLATTSALLPVLLGGGTAAVAGGGTAAAAAGTTGAAGFGITTAAVTAGIGAAAAILIWGISQKGWFRGGEEALKVSPARDQVTQGLLDWVYPGRGVHETVPAGFGPVFSNPSNVATGTTKFGWESRVTALALAGIGGAPAGQLIGAVDQADTMAEYEPAEKHFLAVVDDGLRRTA
jgi:hypothetical protein